MWWKMKIYNIEIKEVLGRVISIQAESSEEAKKKILDLYTNYDIILGENDFYKFEINDIGDDIDDYID